MKVFLPPLKKLTKTDSGDPLLYHYLPLIGYIFRKRLDNTVSLLGRGYDNLLEIGFGSGLLLPELAGRSKNLFGVDIHENIPAVARMLQDLKIKAELKKASVMQLPFDSNFFDAIVAVSIFEHLKPNELDGAMIELRRVMKKNAIVVLSFPTRNLITDIFFQTIGWNAKEWNPRVMHPSSHNDIIAAAQKHFNVGQRLIFPKMLPLNLSLYCSITCLNDK